MAYLVTGATGFVAHNVLERLAARDGAIFLILDDAETATAEFAAAVTAPAPPGRFTILAGNIEAPQLGLSAATLDQLRGEITHLFHLAHPGAPGAADAQDAADAPDLERTTVLGARNVVELANVLDVACLHHLSSLAIAGRYSGAFAEADFDLGQRLRSPYERASFEAERIVREVAVVPWRIYRPSIVLGDSRSGAIDRASGPYRAFPTIRRLAQVLPSWVPLVAPDLGRTNLVPVDYVADAIDFIAHQPGLDGRAFHLANPQPQPIADVFNAFARAAHAPTLRGRLDERLTAPLQAAPIELAKRLPALVALRRQLTQELELPSGLLDELRFSCRIDTLEAAKLLAQSPVQLPPLDSYAAKLWDYWASHLAAPARTAGPAPASTTKPAQQTARKAGPLAGRTVLITGASSGIGRAAALKIAAAGGVPLLVARNAERLEQTKLAIEQEGGVAHVFIADLADPDSVSALVRRVLEAHDVDILVNNAGRSIRRSVKASTSRFHDYERMIAVNYFGPAKLTLELIDHMRTRGGGHITNVSSIGVQTTPPRFSAYVASKAALDAFTRVAAGELHGDAITFTTIHMPLVRTPMIEPTRLYDSFPALSPQAAADMIVDSITRRPRHIGTPLGGLAELAYAATPRLVERILGLAYRAFPDSPATDAPDAAAPDRDADGSGDEPAAAASAATSKPAAPELTALVRFLRGVHW